MDGLDDYIKTSSKGLSTAPKNPLDNPQAKTKIRDAARIAKNYGYDIPDDVADDFYELTSLESGRAHFLDDGKTVKTGVKTPDGDFAIGFSQVMGNTAKPYRSKGLDPYKETDNIIIGLNEFYNGDRNDTVARRLAYVGGPNSPALKEYRRSGRISDAKLYSYLPQNKETYRSYVERSGGFKRVDDYIKSGGETPVADFGAIDDYIKKAVKPDTPPIDQPVNRTQDEDLEAYAQYSAGELSKNAAPLAFDEWQKRERQLRAATPAPEAALQPDAAQEAADLALLGQDANVGESKFGAQLPVDRKQVPDGEFEAWRKYKKLENTPEARRQFEIELAENKDFGKVEAQYEPGKATAGAVLPVSTTPPGRVVSKTGGRSGATDDPGETLAANVEVDLTQKPSDMSTDEYVFRAGLAGAGATPAEVERAVEIYKAAGGGGIRLGRPVRDGAKTVTYQVTRDQLNVARTGETYLKNPDASVKADYENEYNESLLKAAARQDPLAYKDKTQTQFERQTATDEYKENQARRRELEERGYDPDIYDRARALAAPLDGTEPTQEEIDRQYRNELAARLSPERVAQLKAIGQGMKNAPLDEATYGVQSSGAAGIVRGLGGVANLMAGFARYIGEDDAYAGLRKLGGAAVVLDESARSDNYLAKGANIAGGAIVDVPKYMALSLLPGGAVVGFGLDAGLQSYGRGDKTIQATGEAAKGAVLGGLFKVGSKIAQTAETGFKNAMVNPVLEQGAVGSFDRRLAAYLLNEAPPVAKTIGRDVEIAARLFGDGARIGFVGGGTFVTEKSFGASNEEAFYAAVTNAIFDLATAGRHLGGVKNLAGKIFKARDERTGQEADVTITESGEVKLLKEPVPREYVDAELDLSNVRDVEMDADGVYVAAGDQSPARPKATRESVETSPEPRLLQENNPLRVDEAEAKAVAKLGTDARAQKIAELLADGQSKSVEQLAKSSKFKTENVSEAIDTLYRARRIEILPDNTVRAIGDAEPTATEKPLYEKYAESRPPIRLGESSLPVEEQADIMRRPEKRNTDSDYPNLPQQRRQAAATAEPTATVIYEERAAGGALQKVKTERGTTASVQPKVIDSSDILTSLDRGYPQEFQPRDRTRTASKAQISDIANRLDPDFLGDSPKASDGRPLVVPVELNGQTKYAVISGNGRTAAIREAYALGNAPSKTYENFAKTKAPETVAKQPVYVGVLAPEGLDLAEFAKEANESATAKMSATEQAQSDAERLDGGLLASFVAGEDGSLPSAANRDFIRGFMDGIAPSERGALMTADGNLSQEGITRIKNAIFARAFGDSEAGFAAIQRMSESSDNNVRNITSALLAKSGQLVELKEAARRGIRYAEFDISGDLARAMEKYAALRDAGTSVDEYIKQGTLYGAETTPFQTRVMQVFDDYKRSPKAVREIVGNFLDLAEAAGDPNQQSLFGGAAEIDAPAAFEAAVKHYEEQNPNLGEAADQGLPVRPEPDGAIPENAAGENGQTAAAGTDAGEFVAARDAGRIDSSSAEYQRQQAAVTDRLDALNKERVTTLARSARFTVDKARRVLKVNPEAATLVRYAMNQAGGREFDYFIGVYLNPAAAMGVRSALYDFSRRAAAAGDYEASRSLRDALDQLDDVMRGKNQDAAIVVSDEAAPLVEQKAIQEETAHRGDYRVRGFKDLSMDSFLKLDSYDKAFQNLRKQGYSGRREIHNEIIAKTLRDDGAEVLRISPAEVGEIQRAYAKQLIDRGVEVDTIRKEFGNIGKQADKFIENYGRPERNSEQAFASGGGEIGPAGRNRQEIRREGDGDSTEIAERESDRLGKLRQTELLSASERGNSQTGRDAGSNDGRRGNVVSVERSGREEAGQGRRDTDLAKTDHLSALEPVERKYLERVFDGDPLIDRAAEEFALARPYKPTSKLGKAIEKITDVALEIVSIPKSLKSSVDLSAAGRQGAPLTVTEPLFALRAFGRQLKSLREENFKQFKRNLDLHPAIELAEASNLYLSSLAGEDIGSREEAFMSRLLGDDPFFDNKIAEKARRGLTFHVRASERAYVTYLDSIRMDTFAKMSAALHEYNRRKGKADDIEDFKALAHFINVVTGRGTLGIAEPAAPALNVAFFSARYWASRIQLLNPLFYAKLPPHVRGGAIKKMLIFAGATALAMWLLKLGGGEIEYDPESPDFIKLRFGDWRYDLGAGMVQNARYAARMVEAAYERLSGKAEKKSFGEAKEVKLTKTLLRSKLAPTWGGIINSYYGENMVGETTSAGKEALSLISPMIVEDTVKVLKSERGAADLPMLIPSIFGVGTSNYKTRKSAKKPTPKIKNK